MTSEEAINAQDPDEDADEVAEDSGLVEPAEDVAEVAEVADEATGDVEASDSPA